MNPLDLAKTNLSRILDRLPTKSEQNRFAELINLGQNVPGGDAKLLASFGAEAFKAFSSSCRSHGDIAAVAEEALRDAWHHINSIPQSYAQNILAGILAASAQSKARAKKKPRKRAKRSKLSPAHHESYKEILRVLENQGMSHANLSGAIAVSQATLTRRINELKAAGKVKSNRKFGGYYRPDCPPRVNL